MRVLLYSRVNPADGGGVQAVFTRLAAHLRARGHEVERAWRLPNPDRASGDVAYDLPLPTLRWGLPTPRSALRACRALLALGRGVVRRRPVVVNSHYVTAESLYFLLLKPLFRYKVVLSVHGSDVFRPKPWDAPLLPRLLRRADAITAVSDVAAARVCAFPGVDPGRVRVIPNGIDYAFWSAPPAVDAVRLPGRMLSVGRLHPVKGHDVLLRALAAVRARIPGATLAIVGEGDAGADLARLAGALELADAVTFRGRLDAVAVREEMRRAALFVLPSRSEGLPLALLEAMAAGLPCVATRVGGVPEVVVAGSGVLVAPEDPAALAEALAGLLLDRGAAAGLGRAARARAASFSAAAADAAYEDLLVRLAARR